MNSTAQPSLRLITNAFSSYAGETDCLMLTLSGEDLSKIVYSLAPMATEVLNLSEGSVASVNTTLGDLTLFADSDEKDERSFYQNFSDAISAEDGAKAISSIHDIRFVQLGGFHLTISPSSRDRMSVSFVEKFGDENHCTDSLIPTQLVDFYTNTIENKNENPQFNTQFTRMGEWLIICA